METLLEIVELGAERYGDRPALGLRRDDGTTYHWTYAELLRRSRIAAWRLAGLGLAPGDRVLTWSPSTPALPAAYFGAMLARLIFVPLDARMSPDAIGRIADKSGAIRLLMGTGRDAPDPREVGLDRVPTTTIEELSVDPDETFPADWEAQLDAWPRPAPDEVFELVFTSGTTGQPKGVMLAHDNVLEGVGSFHRIIRPMEHRMVSLLPLSHSLEQAVSLYYGLSVGADILYVRSRNPRVIFEALREHRVTTMLLVPQLLDLFLNAIEREVERQGRTATFARLRRIARYLPMGLRRVLFRQVHEQLGGGLRLLASAGAFLPPALQQGWEDLGVIVLQGYGATETAAGCCTTMADHPLGTVGWPPPPVEMRIAEDGEVQFRGPSLFKGYWRDPEATAAAFTDDGWYRSGDLGKLDARRLVLHGSKRRHRPAQRVQGLPRRHGERAADRRHPGLRRGRDQAGPDRGNRAQTRQPRRSRRERDGRVVRDAGGTRHGAVCDRRRGEDGQPGARGEPADRRLASLAHRRLPPDAHVQGEARRGPRLGGGRRRERDRRGRRAHWIRVHGIAGGPSGPVGTRLPGDRDPLPDRLERGRHVDGSRA
jgi:long-chain acyl-CoA synthetase